MQIDIVVRNETIKNTNNSQKTSDKKSNLKEEESTMSNCSKLALISYASYATLDNAKQFANYFLSDIDRRAGDSTANAQINANITNVKKSLGLMAGIVAGAQIGKKGGLTGVLIGGALGGVAGIGSIMWDRATNNRDYKFDRFKDDHSQAVMQARSGISIYNGRQR